MAVSLNIEKVDYEDISVHYRDMFLEIFDLIDPSHVPAFIYIVSDDKGEIGFVSCYNHSLTTCYIQYAGAHKGRRGFLIPKIFNDTIWHIHREYPFILILIENTNVTALKVALNAGFTVIGTRMATGRKLYIELISERSKWDT